MKNLREQNKSVHYVLCRKLYGLKNELFRSQKVDRDNFTLKKSQFSSEEEQFMGLFMCTDNFCGRYRISFEGPNMLLKTNFSEKIYLPCGENHLAHFFSFYRI